MSLLVTARSILSLELGQVEVPGAPSCVLDRTAPPTALMSKLFKYSQLTLVPSLLISLLSASGFHCRVFRATANMAPKSGEKKPAQPVKKAVAKKSTGGRKKGSKKAVESYKIYIYKVRDHTRCLDV